MVTLASMLGKLGLDSSGYTAGLQQAAQKTADFKNRAEADYREIGKSLLDLVEISLTAGGALEMVKRGLEQGEEGAALINLSHGIENLALRAGTTSGAIEETFAAASRGTVMVDDLERQLMVTSNATGASIVENFASYIRGSMALVSEGVGDTMGNLEMITQYIRSGFGRGLKTQLGLIMPSDTDVMNAYAASIGKTADRLTEQEQAQARAAVMLEVLNRRFDLATAGANDAGTSLRRLKTDLAEIGEKAAVTATPGLNQLALSLDSIVTSAAPAVDWLGQVYAWQMKVSTAPMPQGMPSWLGGRGTIGTTGIGGTIGGAANTITSVVTDWLQPALEKGSPVMDFLSGQVEGFADANEGAINSVYGFAASLGLVPPKADETATSIHHVMTETELWNSVGLDGIGMLRASTSATVKFDEALGGLLGTVSRLAVSDLPSTLLGYQKAISGSDMPWQSEYGDTLQGRLQYAAALHEWYADQRTQAEQRVSSAIESAAQKGASAWQDYLGKVQGYISDWKSAAEGLLNPGGTLNVEDMLAATGQRKDKWDESAQRAEAVFADYGNTAKQSWFAGWAQQVEFPMGASNDQARAWAAQYTADFYNNLHPEDVNYDALQGGMQTIVDKNLGQQTIMDQLQTQLTANGLGPDNPQVMQAFDFPGIGDQGGSELATSLATSMLGYNWKGTGKTLMGSVVQGAAEGASSASDALLAALAGPLYPIIKKKLQDEGLFKPPSQP